MSICPPSAPEYAAIERTLSEWTGKDTDVRTTLLALWTAQKGAFEAQYPHIQGEVSSAYESVPGPCLTPTETVMKIGMCDYNTVTNDNEGFWYEADHAALWTLIRVMLGTQQRRKQERADWNAGRTPLQPRFHMPSLFGGE